MDQAGRPDRGSPAVGRPYVDLKRRLSIFRALIFDSSVDDGTPRRAAAPNGPDTRPLLSVRAASIASFSCVASVVAAGGLVDGGGLLTAGRRADPPPAHRSSMASVSESAMITARSMTF